MTHTELQADLAKTLQAQKRLVLREVDLCSRWANVPSVAYDANNHVLGLNKSPGAPRIDVLRVNESYTKFETFAYEVKASRSDFLSDIRKGKWRSYLPYCHRLYFAVDYGVCDAAEVPAECGLLMRRKSGKGWQTVRQAPAREEIEWGADTFLAVLFSIQRQPDNARERLYRQRHAGYAQERKLSKDTGFELGQALSRARRLMAEERMETGDYCLKCGNRVTPYLHQLTPELRQKREAELESLAGCEK